MARPHRRHGDIEAARGTFPISPAQLAAGEAGVQNIVAAAATSSEGWRRDSARHS